MNVKNVKLMAVAAVIIAVCLLFSWVQYGDETPEADDTFDGVWYPVYTYDSGISAEISVPEQLEATVADGSVILTDGVDTAEHILISEHEAVSVSSGVANQLYLEDGILYLISVYNEPDLNGIIYMAMSKDASADLPDDRVDLTGFQVETGWGMVDGTGFTYPGDRAVFSVDSNAFHIARGTIVSGNFDLTLGDDQRFLIPGTILAGGLLMTASSVAAKLLSTGAVLPVGIVTSLVGVPFLFVLLLRETGGVR